MYSTLLAAHIVAGTAAMATGPVALLLRRAPGILANTYLASVLATAVTAGAISVAKWSEFAWLLPLSALTAGLVVTGRRATDVDGPLWMRAHGYGGSYIALVSALFVIWARDHGTGATVAAWALPTAVGVPLIMSTYHRWSWSRGLRRTLWAA